MILIPGFSIWEFDLNENHESNVQALKHDESKFQSGIQFQWPSNLRNNQSIYDLQDQSIINARLSGVHFPLQFKSDQSSRDRMHRFS
jgi:hypothetical protein